MAAINRFIVTLRDRRFACAVLAALLVSFSAASAQDWARAALDKSPRHGEWVTLKHGDRSLKAYIVYPEVSKKTAAVVVVHEIYGLTDWAREVTDEVAAAGYIAIVPDLLSGHGPNGSGSDGFADNQARVPVVAQLDPAAVTADLNAAADYVKNLPSANGKVAVAGFCWGGGESFRFATARHDLSAAFVFYGETPKNLAAITAPVYAFYAGNDERIDATIPATQIAMRTAGKTYQEVTYAGAGHGFMRSGEDPGNTNPDNKVARDTAWARWRTLLGRL